MGELPLLQIFIVVAVAKAFGQLLKRLGQPTVVGEMLAGFVLGPLIFGKLMPRLHVLVFDVSSRAGLRTLGELGLVLFVFLVGTDFVLPTGHALYRRSTGIFIACWSCALPFALGIPLGMLLYSHFACEGVGVLPFTLFISTVLSVTAFPVLAAIVKERGLLQQKEGSVALFAAAIADVMVWLLLSLVLLTHGPNMHIDWLLIALRWLGLTALCLLSMYLVRPRLNRIMLRWINQDASSSPLFSVLLLTALGYAALTNWLQVHPAFGAFLFGACLPRDNRLKQLLFTRIEAVTVTILLPCFFALAGLSVTQGALANVGWIVVSLVILTAVVGKLAGGVIGSHLCGWSWSSSFTVGVLLNARGLMELVVLKIGMDMGIIGPELFSTFFLMTIATTAMTGPLLDILACNRLRDSIPVSL
jgi:Kef-type K+ transport system membrane component KefB